MYLWHVSVNNFSIWFGQIGLADDRSRWFQNKASLENVKEEYSCKAKLFKLYCASINDNYEYLWALKY